MTRLHAICTLRYIISITLLCALPSFAYALEAPNHLDTWAVAFYTFGFSSVLFYSITMLAMREFGWLSYAGYAVLLLALNAALDGTFAFLFGGDIWWMSVAPLLVGALTVTYGFAHVAYRLESPHGLSKLRSSFYILSMLAILLIPGYFVSQAMLPLYVVLNTLMLLMFVAQILPPITWSGLSEAQHRAAFIAPLMVAFFAVSFYSIHFIGEGFSLQFLENANRLGILFHLGQLLVFVALQLVVQISSKQAAEQATLEAAKVAAENALALEISEQQFTRARQAAGTWSRQLATASHDIKQPIAALRSALLNVDDDSRHADTARIRDAVDYLDQLATSYLHLGTQAIDQNALLTIAESDDELRRKVDGQEQVSTAVLIDTLAQMYESEARNANIQLDIHSRELLVRVQPLVMIRILSNLISNAIDHSGAKRVLIGVRRCGPNVRLEVHDNGCGMSKKELAEATKLRARGENSTGSGLGLAIAVVLAEDHGLSFKLLSRQGYGTSGLVEVSCAMDA